MSGLNQTYPWNHHCHAEEVARVCFQVRWEALQALCSAPPSDVLGCENWNSLQKHFSAALADPELSVSPGRPRLLITVTIRGCTFHY